jgi:hypothetical protein
MSKIPVLFIGSDNSGREVRFFHGHLEDGVPAVPGAREPPTQWLMMMPGSAMSPQPERSERRPIKNL